MQETLMALNLTIRPLQDRDYKAVSEALNAIWPDEVQTEAGMREDDRDRDPHCKTERFVAEVDGHVVGYTCRTMSSRSAWTSTARFGILRG
ncbi:MAG: hypothetical protein C4332_11110 [Meiothermus sp.]